MLTKNPKIKPLEKPYKILSETALLLSNAIRNKEFSKEKLNEINEGVKILRGPFC